METKLEKFNPTLAELQALVESTKGITAKDLTDKNQLAVVKENRLKLRDARTTITKVGKEYRAEALEYQRLVIVKEKELLAIITPEEDRLKAIEEEAKNLEILEERKKVLPWRKEQLLGIGDGESMPTEQELLQLTDEEFNTHVTNRKLAKLDKQEAEAREKQEAENREKEKEEAAAKAVEEERERAAKEAKLKEEREAKEAEEAKQKEAEELARTEKNKKYQTFLKKNGYTEETKDDYKIVREGDTFKLYKLVDTVTIK